MIDKFFRKNITNSGEELSLFDKFCYISATIFAWATPFVAFFLGASAAEVAASVLFAALMLAIIPRIKEAKTVEVSGNKIRV